MKAVILAGGMGTRLAEETHIRPKPLVEIGGWPIIWHIMKIYSHHGVNDFIICCGYKGHMIKEFFSNYFLHTSDMTFDLVSNQMKITKGVAEPWRVTLVDTGESAMTGGRLRCVRPYLESEENFCMTYGDGVSDIDIGAEISFHCNHGKLATVAAVQPASRYGSLELEGTNVTGFVEKPVGESGYINGGFFVLSRQCIEWIDGEDTVWEAEPLTKLAAAGQLAAFKHSGFWQSMDTVRDCTFLNNLWMRGEAPWKNW